MKEAIKYFINTSDDDLEYIFGEKSFAFFFYTYIQDNHATFQETLHRQSL